MVSERPGRRRAVWVVEKPCGSFVACRSTTSARVPLPTWRAPLGSSLSICREERFQSAGRSARRWPSQPSSSGTKLGVAVPVGRAGVGVRAAKIVVCGTLTSLTTVDVPQTVITALAHMINSGDRRRAAVPSMGSNQRVHLRSAAAGPMAWDTSGQHDHRNCQLGIQL
jgi:hypothetical protein